MRLLLLTLVSSVAAAEPLALRALSGPFASLEEACPTRARVASPPDAAFCGASAIAVRTADGWFRGPLPLDGALTPRRVESGGGVLRFYVTQNAFRADGVDQDGDWLVVCAKRACSRAIPLRVRDQARGVDVEVIAEVPNVSLDGDRLTLDVVYRKLRFSGEGPRVAGWRALAESLRGHHAVVVP